MTQIQGRFLSKPGTRLRRWISRGIAIAWGAVAVVALSACAATSSGPPKQDIVTQIPWTAPETHKYELRVNNKPAGESILSIDKSGDNFVFTVLHEDGKGDSESSTTTVEAATLKPVSNVHTVADPKERRVADATYADESKDCSSKRVVKITQNTFKPADESTPESTRSNPLCVPEHSYDNDESLFLWRTIKFEKGYTVTYTTVFSNRRDTQTVTLTVGGQQKVQTPAGEFDAWVVDVAADQVTQRAWIATAPDHTLVAYQNESFFFRLVQ